MRIRENLGSIISNNNKGGIFNFKLPIGKVFGVITTENTPTKEIFENNGGWNAIGTVFYLDYELSKDYGNDVDLSKCKIAKPFYDNIQNYPLLGELILLIDAPSPSSQITNSSSQKYYIGTVNLWNNNQQNSPSNNVLGKTFIEQPSIRKLISFEGDRIFYGRKGNSLRFSSTIKNLSNINEWSNVGEDGDPITIISNGHIIKDINSLKPNIEEINKEESSIYLTSTQQIPLSPDKNNNLNPFTKPLLPNKYFSSQIILNSNRIVLNSKKDDILLFAKTNIEFNTKNIINLNADKRVHFNTPNVLLGTKKDGTAPDEPLLLGNKTKELLNDLFSLLQELGNNLSTVITPSQGSPLTGVNIAGSNMVSKLENLQKQLKTITSTSNFTI